MDPILLIAHDRPRSTQFTKRGPGRRRLLGKPHQRLQRVRDPQGRDYITTDRLTTMFLNAAKGLQ